MQRYLVPDPIREQTRRAVRARRRALTAKERCTAALAARTVLARSGLLRRGARVGVYLAVRGEIDTAPIIELARHRGCKLFAPVIDCHRQGDMRFASLAGTLRANRIGILEPDHVLVSGRSLDMVLVPIVAFGPHGERLGTGGGYYDRTFAYLRRRAAWLKPRLVGLAYHWQRVAELKARPWDVPLTAVITDREVLRFPARAETQT
jgi:5-formyltetrahydrofolate cyclo-ligase